MKTDYEAFVERQLAWDERAKVVPHASRAKLAVEQWQAEQRAVAARMPKPRRVQTEAEHCQKVAREIAALGGDLDAIARVLERELEYAERRKRRRAHEEQARVTEAQRILREVRAERANALRESERALARR